MNEIAEILFWIGIAFILALIVMIILAVDSYNKSIEERDKNNFRDE